MNLRFQGAGARPWLLERRNGVARRIYFRLVAGDRCSGNQILHGAQYCPYTLLVSSGYSAYLMTSGSSPAYLYGRRGDDGDFTFAQETSTWGRFAQPWDVRAGAQEAAPKGAANEKLRGLLARNRSLKCTGVSVGGPAGVAVIRKSPPRRRGPAATLGID